MILSQIPRMFGGVEVVFHERRSGELVLTAEVIGRCLGYKDPARRVHDLYGRHADELEPHRGVAKLQTPGGAQEVTTFTERGAYLIAMFARTEKAKAWRLWLAETLTEIRSGDKRLVSQEALDAILHENAELRGMLGDAYANLQSFASLGGRMLSLYGHAKRRHPEISGEQTPQLRLFEEESSESSPELEGEATS